jgi:hypothetical protein
MRLLCTPGSSVMMVLLQREMGGERVKEGESGREGERE